MAENAKAGKNKIGDNKLNPRLTISSCLRALVAKSSLRSLWPLWLTNFQSNLRVVADKNQKIEKIFISFSNIELRESEIKNRALFSTQTRTFAQL